MAAAGPGPRDHLITRSLERDLASLAPETVDAKNLDPVEAPERLARHAMQELRRELAGDDEPADAQARRVNDVLRIATGQRDLESEVAIPARVLQGIKDR